MGLAEAESQCCPAQAEASLIFSLFPLLIRGLAAVWLLDTNVPKLREFGDGPRVY